MNEWHHLAAVVDSSSYTLYYDGVAIDQRSFTGDALLLDADHGFTIGAVGPFPFPHGEDFHGWIDDVRVYSRALSSTEVADAMECDTCGPVLDQQHDFEATAEGTVRSDKDRAQTFTVGATGLLTRVDLRVRRPDASTTAPLLLDVRSTSSGAPVEPNTPVLASVSIPAAAIPIASLATTPFTSIDLSGANLQVSTGDVLAIVLRSDNQYEWASHNTGGYSGGSEFNRSPETSHQWDLGPLDDDFAFKTFVVQECVIDAVIDVKFGSDANSTNLSNNGMIAVAILTTAEFDATAVNASSVIFAGASALQWAFQDADGDGNTDLVLHFRTQETNLGELYEQLLADDINEDGILDSSHQQAAVSLSGLTTSDELFRGVDDVDLFLAGRGLRELLDTLAAEGAL